MFSKNLGGMGGGGHPGAIDHFGAAETPGQSAGAATGYMSIKNKTKI